MLVQINMREASVSAGLQAAEQARKTFDEFIESLVRNATAGSGIVFKGEVTSQALLDMALTELKAKHSSLNVFEPHTLVPTHMWANASPGTRRKFGKDFRQAVETQQLANLVKDPGREQRRAQYKVTSAFDANDLT